MAIAEIGIIAGMVKAVAEVWGQYLITADKRKAEECKKAAREYIQVDNKEDTYATISDDKAKSLKVHFRKRFEKYY